MKVLKTFTQFALLFLCISMNSNAAHAIDKKISSEISSGIGANINSVDETPFTVSIAPTKNNIKVNEPITLQIKGNDVFYLYLFAIDSDSDNATLIFPNKYQSGNKFLKDQVAVIPNKKVQFLSDRNGQEKLIMIASKHYFKWNTNGYTQAGAFLSTSNKVFTKQLKSFQLVDDAVGNRHEDEQPFTFEPSNQRSTLKKGMFIKEFIVNISSVNRNNNAAMISKNKD